MFDSLVVIMTYVTAVFMPVLIPATVHAAHFVRERHPAHRPLRAAVRVSPPRAVASRRAVPAVC
ncbi:hypothetical protein [Mycobacterium terramassiliense]|uniref:Mycobacterium terramassiliense ORFan n=1 Tax=Mycobacterium terramassiliense TaxID=1841859 RepID=A0A2U3NAC7_9MYCO|nr:hypothetical protein [Mycobacterium terramassiliense]SPM28491.1 Mycobacterium terramassiliense ORFan [Mycobacterium terramassiliense]